MFMFNSILWRFLLFEVCKLSWHSFFRTGPVWPASSDEGSVYVTQGRLSRLHEFTPFLSRGTVFFLHDTNTEFHAGLSHTDVCSPRLLYRGENFIPVRNFATVSCKPQKTTRFDVKWVCRWPNGHVVHAFSSIQDCAVMLVMVRGKKMLTRYEIKKPSGYETRVGASFLM